MTGRLAISGALVAACFTSGCATLRANPTRCRVVTTVASAALVGTASAAATSAAGADAGAIVAATVGAAAVGTMAGLVMVQPVCQPDAAAAPVSPPAPSPPP